MFLNWLLNISVTLLLNAWQRRSYLFNFHLQEHFKAIFSGGMHRIHHYTPFILAFSWGAMFHFTAFSTAESEHCYSCRLVNRQECRNSVFWPHSKTHWPAVDLCRLRSFGGRAVLKDAFVLRERRVAYWERQDQGLFSDSKSLLTLLTHVLLRVVKTLHRLKRTE